MLREVSSKTISWLCWKEVLYALLPSKYTWKSRKIQHLRERQTNAVVMRRGKFVLNSQKIYTLKLQGSDGRKWAVVPSFSYGFFNLKAYMCHYWKEHNTTGADDRTINLQSVLVTRALSLKNWSFRLHEHDKMHSSRIVITHFNQARKNYHMNKFTAKQTLNKNKTRQKSKANKIRHSNNAMWQYLMQNLRKSADLFLGLQGVKLIFFFFLIATWLLNFSKW